MQTRIKRKYAIKCGPKLFLTRSKLYGFIKSPAFVSFSLKIKLKNKK